MSPLNAAICTTISYTLWVEWYYIKNNYLTSRSKVKVQRRSLRYAIHRLMVMHPHTKYHRLISRQKCYGLDKKILFKKQLFDLEVKDQGPTKVIMIRDTPPYGHASTYEISLTYLERQKRYGLDKLRWEEAEEEEKIRLKQYVSLHSKGRHNNLLYCGVTMVRDASQKSITGDACCFWTIR
jgi:hypothetical protein